MGLHYRNDHFLSRLGNSLQDTFLCQPRDDKCSPQPGLESSLISIRSNQLVQAERILELAKMSNLSRFSTDLFCNFHLYELEKIEN